MTQKNDRAFLTRIITECRTSGFDPILFGGWAEEMQGKHPWVHKDVDFLLVAENFNQLDELISRLPDWTEILQKRFVHKRAAIVHDIMIEFILIKEQDGLLVTKFFGSYQMIWPRSRLWLLKNLLGLEIKVAARSTLDFYRMRHSLIKKAYQMYSE